jgi:hypothetical protein
MCEISACAEMTLGVVYCFLKPDKARVKLYKSSSSVASTIFLLYGEGICDNSLRADLFISMRYTTIICLHHAIVVSLVPMKQTLHFYPIQLQ